MPSRIYLPALVLALISDALWPFVLREFARASTCFNALPPSAAVIRSGPFKFSRNPSYVALTIAWLGLGLLLDNLWVLVWLIPAVLLVHFGVVLREERYLEGGFGEEYLRLVDSSTYKKTYEACPRSTFLRLPRRSGGRMLYDFGGASPQCLVWLARGFYTIRWRGQHKLWLLFRPFGPAPPQEG